MHVDIGGKISPAFQLLHNDGRFFLFPQNFVPVVEYLVLEKDKWKVNDNLFCLLQSLVVGQNIRKLHKLIGQIIIPVTLDVSLQILLPEEA